jgi:hypothetical protein
LVSALIFGLCVAPVWNAHSAPINPATYVPANAKVYLPTLKKEQVTLWPNNQQPWYLAALIEQESCVSLTSKRCWNPNSSLKTYREEGAGLGQITRTFNKDGSVRADYLQDQVRQHSELEGWNWGNVYERPDLQIRSIVLMNRSNYSSLQRMGVAGTELPLFGDAAYNGGVGGVSNDRRLCALTKGCNPAVWFGHVSNTCTKSKIPNAAYGNKSMCDINREHVYNVDKIRVSKYQQLWSTYP